MITRPRSTPAMLQGCPLVGWAAATCVRQHSTRVHVSLACRRACGQQQQVLCGTDLLLPPPLVSLRQRTHLLQAAAAELLCQERVSGVAVGIQLQR